MDERRGNKLKVKIHLNREMNGDPYAQIVTNKITPAIDMLADSIRKISFTPTLIAYKFGWKPAIPVSEIIRIYTENKIVVCITADSKYKLRSRIYQLENILPKNIFIRISSSEIVNLNQVKQFDLTAAGMFKVMFKNGNSTFASRRYIKKIQEALSR